MKKEKIANKIALNRDGKRKHEELSQKQILFALEYIIDFNGTRAAIAAGYSPKTAHVQASRLLTYAKVKQKIAEMVEKRNKLLEIDANWVLSEALKLYKTNVSNFVKYDAAGHPYLDLKAGTAEQISGIEDLNIESTKISGMQTTHIKLKLPNKTRLLDLIGKHANVQAFQERVKIEGEIVMRIYENEEDI